MQIEPIEPLLVVLSQNSRQARGYMKLLTDDELTVSCHEYFEKGKEIHFKSKCFSGIAYLVFTEFSKYNFNYTLRILSIHFKPGLLINQRL